MKLKKLLFASLVCIFSTCLFSQVESVSGAIFKKSYWQTFDWSSAPKSAVWNSPEFIDQPESPSDLKIRYTKQKKFSFQGRPFTASLIVHEGRTQSPHSLFVHIDNATFSQCEEASLFGNKYFGIPSDPVSYRYEDLLGEKLSIRTEKMTFQWESRTTMISLDCGKFSFGNDKPIENILFRFEKLTEESVIEKPRSLSCERALVHYLDPDTSRALTPISFTWVPNDNVIIHPDGFVWGRVAARADSYIEFFLPAKDHKLKYRVSRIDGSLSGSMLRDSDERAVARLTGACKAIDLKEKVF